MSGPGRGDAGELHDRFAAWLVGDRSAAPSRDVAFHAVFCGECRRAISAVDLLGTIDVGALALPAVPTIAGRPVPTAGRAAPWRLAASAAAVLVVATGSAVALSGGLFRVPGLASPTPTPDQGVLGGTGGSPGSTSGGSVEASGSAIVTASGIASPSPGAPASGAPVLPSSVPLPFPTATPFRSPTGSPSASPRPTLGPTPTPSATRTAPPPSAPPSETPAASSAEASPSVEPSAAGG